MKPTLPVLRVQGRVPDMSAEQKQIQWLQALFAYAELHCNLQLAVSPALERQRRVPAGRWRYHRLLLDSHAALLCRFSKEQVHRLQERACQTLHPDASREAIENALGAYQLLDAHRMVEQCPFFLGDALANTFWEGWVAEPESAEDPAHTVSVRLAGLRDPQALRAGTKRSTEQRSLVIVAGHALPKEGHGDTWGAAFEPATKPGDTGAIELCYACWTEPLGTPGSTGEFAISRTTLVDAIPLTGGRAAWAVGVRVLDGACFGSEEVEQALGAAVEMVASVGQGQREGAEPSWQLPVMAAAQLAQESVAAILETFSALGSAMYEQAWPSASPACIYDSKYLYALSPAAEPRSMTLPAGPYEVELEVAIGREPVSISGLRLERNASSPAQRWSMFRARGAKRETETGSD